MGYIAIVLVYLFIFIYFIIIFYFFIFLFLFNDALNTFYLRLYGERSTSELRPAPVFSFIVIFVYMLYVQDSKLVMLVIRVLLVRWKRV